MTDTLPLLVMGAMISLLLILLFCAAVLLTSAQPLPDLTVSKSVLSATLVKSTRASSDDCLVDSGCVPDLGVHTLLRFATRVDNVAAEGGDLVFGSPPPNPDDLPTCDSVSGPTNETAFCTHVCHDHVHLLGFVQADLLYENGTRAADQVKHSFCLADTSCFRDGARLRYGCHYQGLTAGCSDTYAISLPCQWIVVDGVAADVPLTLRITVDPTNFIAESDNDNNAVEITIVLDDVPSGGGHPAAWAVGVAAALAAALETV